jgi:hypothetical protein
MSLDDEIARIREQYPVEDHHQLKPEQLHGRRGPEAEVNTLPFGPLEDHVVARCPDLPRNRRSDGTVEVFTTAAIAEMLGISTSSVRKYRLRGVSIWRADELAVRLGRHPMDIWGPAAYGGAS